MEQKETEPEDDNKGLLFSRCVQQSTSW